MKCTQLNACLVLLLVAVSVHYSYEAVFGATCTEDEDCESSDDESFCHTYDQCAKGVCACKDGYSHANGKCKELRKIGDSCDSTETCYAGNCTDGECTCFKGLPSDNDKMCGREYGEDCAHASDCYGEAMACPDGECVCISNYKEYEYTAEFGETHTSCVPSNANIEVKETLVCDLHTAFCDTDLMCRSCPDSQTLKCMSGVGRLSVCTLAFGGLLVAAILALLF